MLANITKTDQPAFWSVLNTALGGMSILILIAMAALTCVDVVARYWFNSPINGAFELTQMLLAALIFSALPMTTAAGQHVDVELFTSAFGARLEKLFVGLGQLLTGIVLLVIGWQVWRHADELVANGTVTNSLGLPYGPIGYFAAVSCFTSGIIALVLTVQVLGIGQKKQEVRYD